MKRVLTILFSLLFVAISTGFTTYQHICKGLLQQTTVSHTQTSKTECGFCKIKKQQVENPQKECCKEKVEIVKVKTEVQKSPIQVLKLFFFADSILHRYFGSVFDCFVAIELNTPNFVPYVYHIREIPIYIKNCVYRI